MTTLYGIKNCDTVRKARRWLEAHNIDYGFHDFRQQGLDRELLASWVDELGWEVLLNKRGTTWRKLPEKEKDNLDREKAIELMLTHPAMIKRPVLNTGKHRLVGFNEENYLAEFS